MKTYRKKADVTIQAIQLDGADSLSEEVRNALADPSREIFPGDYLIQKSDGTYLIKSGAEFEDKFEEVQSNG